MTTEEMAQMWEDLDSIGTEIAYASEYGVNDTQGNSAVRKAYEKLGEAFSDLDKAVQNYQDIPSSYSGVSGNDFDEWFREHYGSDGEAAEQDLYATLEDMQSHVVKFGNDIKSALETAETELSVLAESMRQLGENCRNELDDVVQQLQSLN